MLSGTSFSQAAGELVGLIASVGAGVVVARYEYKKKKLAKRIDKIKEIMALHSRILNKITVNDQLDLELHLPEIFKIGSENDASTIEALHFSDAILNDINNSISSNGKGELLTYDVCIEAAVSKIHAFYNRRIHQRIIGKRGSPEDDTSVVLCYLIEMLNTHCSKFEGYDVDIAVLNSLAEFTNAFASLHGKNSDRMRSLTPVYDYLMRAKNILIKHSRVLSLDDLVEDLIRSAKLYSFRMLKNFARLITPVEYWTHIDTISIEEIVRGIVKPKSVHFKGKFFTKEFWTEDNAITFSDSILTDWLVRCAKDFLLAIESNCVKDEKDFNVEKSKFKRDFTENERHKLKKNVFDVCENFLTIKPVKEDKESATDKIVHIETDPELLERMNVIADYADVIEVVLVTLYFGVKFQKSIKQLGEIYSETPQHFRAVYCIWENLGMLTRKMANQLQIKITDLQSQNTNMELLAREQSLLPDIIDTLRFVQGKIATCIENIVVKHGKKNEPFNPSTLAHSEKYHLFLIAKMIGDEYGIPLPAEHIDRLPQVNEHPVLEDTDDAKEEKAEIPEEKYTESIAEEKEPVEEYINIPETLDSLIAQLKAKIHDITKESAAKKQKVYEDLYLSLVYLRAKNLFLIGEHRNQKADELQRIGMMLCGQVLEFLNREKSYQAQHAKDFLAGIKNTIATAVFINKHKPGHKLLDFLHVNTQTKKLTNKVEVASAKLVKSLG